MDPVGDLQEGISVAVSFVEPAWKSSIYTSTSLYSPIICMALPHA